MDIHEYQAKELLSGFGVPIPRGAVAYSAEQASFIATELGGWHWAVKAQIHAGAPRQGRRHQALQDLSRGAATRPRRCSAAKLVTHQTGPEGKIVQRVYIEVAEPFEREIYFGYRARPQGRAHARHRLRRGRHGDRGDREEPPEAILQVIVEPAVGLQAFQARELAFGLGLNIKQVSQRGGHDPGRLSRVSRSGCDHGRDQSAGGDQGRSRARARRQDVVRRQRAVPPPERGRDARPVAGGSARGAGLGGQPQLRRSRAATSAASSTARGWRWRRWT